MQVLSGASYDYIKLCVNELQSQLHDADSNSTRKLVQSAYEERNHFFRSGHLINMSDEDNSNNSNAFTQISTCSTVRRHNPFDGEPFDRDSMNSERESVMEKKARTFLEMHEEFRQQIREITEEWLKTHEHTAFAGQHIEACT